MLPRGSLAIGTPPEGYKTLYRTLEINTSLLQSVGDPSLSLVASSMTYDTLTDWAHCTASILKLCKFALLEQQTVLDAHALHAM